MIYITPTRTKPLLDNAQCKAFEITDGNRRVSCTLTTSFLTQDQASRYFHSNRPMLERMARSKLLTSGLEDGKIRLVLLP
jgi:hypothetical protein